MSTALKTQENREAMLELLRALEVYKLEMESDEELLEFLGWHYDTLTFKSQNHKVRKSELDAQLADRFTEVINTLEIYRAAGELSNNGKGVMEISRSLQKPSQTISTWLKETKPILISKRYLSLRREKRKRPLTREEMLGLIESYALELIESSAIRIPEGERTCSLADLVYLNEGYFEVSYKRLKLRKALRKLDVPWYEALVQRFVKKPEKEGREPLRIPRYRNRKLRKWMFSGDIKGKWNSIDDRIDAVQALCESLVEQGRELTDIKAVDFESSSNPLKIGLWRLLDKIAELYGEKSHYIAMVEAGMITHENFGEFQKNSKFRLPLTTFWSIRDYAIVELLKLGYSKQYADNIFGLMTKLGKTGVKPCVSDEIILTEELKDELRNMPNRREVILGLRLMGYTLEQIGEVYGLTRERIRQLETPIYVTKRQLRDSIKTLNRMGVMIEQVDDAFPDSRGYNEQKIIDFARPRGCNPVALRAYLTHRNEVHNYRAA